MSLCDETPKPTITHNTINHQAHEELQRAVESWIALGNKITEVPAGATADPMATRHVVNEFDASKPGEYEQRRKASAKGNAVVKARQTKVPRPKVDVLEGGLYMSKKGIAKLLGLSEPKLYAMFRLDQIQLAPAKTYKGSSYFLTTDVLKYKTEVFDEKH